ncbi:MAG: hypothetical protein VX768_20080 [Planctomycetota bacterium]|nr:hypothetical protein [Planctomycetota bacterium]
MHNHSRRKFLTTSASVSGVGLLAGLPVVSSRQANLAADQVRFYNGIEPTVRLIEQTSREKLLDAVADRIRKGLSYREVLAALFLAGIRNVQPRPSVGFKFHCVLVVNSCHLASLSGPDSDRWLPIFWALDYFKSSQGDESRRSGWKMSPVDESQIPSPRKCRQEFITAMQNWDVARADVAAAGVVRHLGAVEVFGLFARFAARDYRSIGHKAIYLANAWRTLQVIGWEFAEPIMRSLAFALLNHNGETNPSEADHLVDRPWRTNGERIAEIPQDWLGGKIDHGVPKELFSVFREGDPDASSRQALQALKKGVSPQSIWDGIFVGAGELLMRQPGIIGLHGLTTANAMHFLWKTTGDDQLRRRLLLQASSFQPLFRESAKKRGKLAARYVGQLGDDSVPLSKREPLGEILAEISSDPLSAARKTRRFLGQGGSSYRFVDATRRLFF